MEYLGVISKGLVVNLTFLAEKYCAIFNWNISLLTAAVCYAIHQFGCVCKCQTFSSQLCNKLTCYVAFIAHRRKILECRSSRSLHLGVWHFVFVDLLVKWAPQTTSLPLTIVSHWRIVIWNKSLRMRWSCRVRINHSIKTKKPKPINAFLWRRITIFSWRLTPSILYIYICVCSPMWSLDGGVSLLI